MSELFEYVWQRELREQKQREQCYQEVWLDAKAIEELERPRLDTQKLHQHIQDLGSSVDCGWFYTPSFLDFHNPWEQKRRLQREKLGRPVHHPSPEAVECNVSHTTLLRLLNRKLQ